VVLKQKSSLFFSSCYFNILSSYVYLTLMEVEKIKQLLKTHFLKKCSTILCLSKVIIIRPNLLRLSLSLFGLLISIPASMSFEILFIFEENLEYLKNISAFGTFCPSVFSRLHIRRISLYVSSVTCLLPKNTGFVFSQPSEKPKYNSFSECAFHKITTKVINMNLITLHDPQYQTGNNTNKYNCAFIILSKCARNLILVKYGKTFI